MESSTPETERPRSGGAAWPRGPRNHPNPPKPMPVAFGPALFARLPSAFDFEPRYRAAVRLFGNRVTIQTIRAWCAGRRRAPLWAKQILADELRKQIAARQHVLALLEADMEPKPDPLIGEVRNP